MYFPSAYAVACGIPFAAYSSKGQSAPKSAAPQGPVHVEVASISPFVGLFLC